MQSPLLLNVLRDRRVAWLNSLNNGNGPDVIQAVPHSRPGWLICRWSSPGKGGRLVCSHQSAIRQLREAGYGGWLGQRP